MKDIFPYIFGFLISLVMLAVAAYFAWQFRHRIREKIKAWLHAQNLDKSALMDILFVCDDDTGAAKKIVCKIFAVTKETGEQQISEEMLTPEELEKLYPDVYSQLQKQGHAKKSILQQIA